MKITLEKLEKLDACKEAREWFAEKFPKGATVAQALRACPQGDWLIWGLGNLKLATIEQVILLSCVAARRALRFIPVGEDRPRLAIEAAELVAENNTPENRAAARAAWAAWDAWDAAGDAGDAGAARAAGDAAWAAARAAEHLAIASAMRAMMRTDRYRKAGKK